MSENVFILFICFTLDGKFGQVQNSKLKIIFLQNFEDTTALYSGSSVAEKSDTILIPVHLQEFDLAL